MFRYHSTRVTLLSFDQERAPQWDGYCFILCLAPYSIPGQLVIWSSWATDLRATVLLGSRRVVFAYGGSKHVVIPVGVPSKQLVTASIASETIANGLILKCWPTKASKAGGFPLVCGLVQRDTDMNTAILLTH